MNCTAAVRVHCTGTLTPCITTRREPDFRAGSSSAFSPAQPPCCSSTRARLRCSTRSSSAGVHHFRSRRRSPLVCRCSGRLRGSMAPADRRGRRVRRHRADAGRHGGRPDRQCRLGPWHRHRPVSLRPPPLAHSERAPFQPAYLVSPVGASCVALGSAVRSAEDCDGPTGVVGFACGRSRPSAVTVRLSSSPLGSMPFDCWNSSARPASLAPSCRRPQRRASPGPR